MGLRDLLSGLILNITNLVYFLAGVGVLTVGALGLSNASTIIDLLTFVPKIEELSKVIDIVGIAVGPAIYLTVMGSLVIILSFMSCGGVYKKNKIVISIIFFGSCMVGPSTWAAEESNGLFSYFGITTLLMMIFNVAVIMFNAIDPYFVEGQVQDGMMRQLETKFSSAILDNNNIVLPEDPTAEAWNVMQFEQGCCGVVNYTDYTKFEWNYTVGATVKVPLSCCLLINPGVFPVRAADFVNSATCLGVSDTSQYVNARGCSDYVMQQVTRYNFIYTVTAAAFTGLQAIILCLTLRHISKESKHNTV